MTKYRKKPVVIEAMLQRIKKEQQEQMNMYDNYETTFQQKQSNEVTE